jgi:hypothetical protein
MAIEHQHEPAHIEFKTDDRLVLKRLDPGGTFVRQIRPNPPCAFALLEPDNGSRRSVSHTVEMQDQLLACALCVCEVIKIDDAAIWRAHKVHGQLSINC